MTYQHYQPHQRQRGAASVLRGLAAAIVLVAATVGLPWMFLTLAGSPIPGRLPGWEEITSALSRRDDGTLLLGFIKYLAWAVWLAWTALVLLESASQLRGRSAPQIPGLAPAARRAANQQPGRDSDWNVGVD